MFDMFDTEFYFALPPAVPQEMALPEAFERAVQSRSALVEVSAQKMRRGGKKNLASTATLMSEFLSDAKNERAVSASALRLLQADLEMYERWLEARGVTKWRAVSENLIAQYEHDLRSGQAHDSMPRQRPALRHKLLAASAVARKLAAVRHWHQFLARVYKWPNPATNASETSLVPTSSLALSAEQIKKILAANKASTVPDLRNYAILCLLCDGFSSKEIRDLRLEECEGEWPCGEPARGAVQDYKARARPLLLARLRKKGLYSRRLFFSNRGTPLSPLLMQQIVRRAVKAAQLPAWVAAAHLSRAGRARRERGATLDDDGAMEVAALPRVAQLRHAYTKAHPRA